MLKALVNAWFCLAWVAWVNDQKRFLNFMAFFAEQMSYCGHFVCPSVRQTYRKKEKGQVQKEDFGCGVGYWEVRFNVIRTMERLCQYKRCVCPNVGVEPISDVRSAGSTIELIWYISRTGSVLANRKVLRRIPTVEVEKMIALGTRWEQSDENSYRKIMAVESGGRGVSKSAA